MYSNDLKIRAVGLYWDGYSFRSISTILNIPKSTIHRWFHSDLSINVKTHRSHKYNETDVSSIKQLLIDDPFTTAKNIISTLHLKLSTTTIYHIFHSLGFTRKKPIIQLFTNLQSLSAIKHTFKNTIQNIHPSKIISIDETYIYPQLYHDYGWAIGRFKQFRKNNQPKFSVIMAISNKKIIDFEIHRSNINGTIFHSFLNNKICNIYKNKYILMDNVRFHKCKFITDLITNSNNKCLFIPPYSPQFNPIENVFSKIKHNFKKLIDTDIPSKFQKCISLITKNDLNNYYLHALK